MFVTFLKKEKGVGKEWYNAIPDMNWSLLYYTNLTVSGRKQKRVLKVDKSGLESQICLHDN